METLEQLAFLDGMTFLAMHENKSHIRARKILEKYGLTYDQVLNYIANNDFLFKTITPK